MPGDLGSNAQDMGGGPGTNRVLVIAASPIIRIVIARTIERIYLKPIPVAPEAALEGLSEHRLVMVIADGAMHESLLDPLLAELARQRRASERGLPRVLLIDDLERPHETPPLKGLADAVVAKPITPDILQPAVERLLKG